MVNQSIIETAERFAKLIPSNLKVRKAYLFGSYAYNTANKDSDIDIFVVADLKGKKKIEITQNARRLLIGNVSMPIDILVCDLTDFNQRKDNQSTFEYIISTEGQKIYG